MKDFLQMKKEWTITRYQNDEDYQDNMPSGVIDSQTGDLLPAVSKIEGNLMLNEGIAELLLLLTGGGGTAYSNANAFLGVGDSSTAESAAQTALQASSNKLYKAMEATYPTISGQTVTWRSVFGSSDANFA